MIIKSTPLGAVRAQLGETAFLFEAPLGVEQHIPVADYILLTKGEAPGCAAFRNAASFLRRPLNVGDLQATPIERTHGCDYEVRGDGARVLVTLRGDVAVKDVVGYDAAFIGNKQSSSRFGEHVRFWPWPDDEFEIVTKPWSSMEQVPEHLKELNGTSLTLAQVNWMASIADNIEDENIAWATARARFKENYTKKDGRWVRKQQQAEKDCQSAPEQGTDVLGTARVVLGLIDKALPIDELRPGQLTVYKDEAGQSRWASVSSVDMWDRHRQRLSTGAMDFAVAYCTLFGRGPLRHEHLPGLDGGECDCQMRVGDVLFEGGYFYDTFFGRAMHDLYASKSYGVSLGLRYRVEDLVDSVFKKVVIFERSGTERPAVPTTTLGVIEMKKEELDAALKKAAADLKLPEDVVRDMYERAVAMKGEAALGSLEVLKAALSEAQSVQTVLGLVGSLSDDARTNLFAELGKAYKVNEGMQETEEADEEEEDETMKVLKTLAVQNAQMIQALVASSIASQTKGAPSDLFAQYLDSLPTASQAQFLTGKKTSRGGTSSVTDILEVRKELADVAEMLKTALNPNAFYGQFTSPELNTRPNPLLDGGTT